MTSRKCFNSIPVVAVSRSLAEDCHVQGLFQRCSSLYDGLFRVWVVCIIPFQCKKGLYWGGMAIFLKNILEPMKSHVANDVIICYIWGQMNVILRQGKFTILSFAFHDISLLYVIFSPRISKLIWSLKNSYLCRANWSWKYKKKISMSEVHI